VSVRVELREAAVLDVTAIFEFLAFASPGSSPTFIRALEEAILRLSDHPRIGHPVDQRHPRLRGVRSWPVPGFPSIFVFYVPSGAGVSIVRVLHGARDLPTTFLEGRRQGEEE